MARLFRSHLFSRVPLASLALFAVLTCSAGAQTESKPSVEREAAGDSPADPGPLATGLSPALTRAAIEAAMRRVADWQLAYSAAKVNQQWTYAALYDGLVATSRATGDPKYTDVLATIDEGFHWQLLDERFPHADDQALGQSYLDLYRLHPEPIRLASTKVVMDRLLTVTDDPAKPVWWWCDALFMAPPRARAPLRHHRRPQVHRSARPRMGHHHGAAL